MPAGTSRSGLIIPGSARSVAPTHYCRLCGRNFTAFQLPAYERHVRACAQENGEFIAALVHKHNEIMMERPKWADLSYEDWIRDRAAECKARGIDFTTVLNKRPKE